MKTFLCQKIDGDITLDFVLATKHAIEYANWLSNKEDYKIEYTEDLSSIVKIDRNVIPVGTVEFVHEYYRKYFNIENILPVNIPKELMKYSGGMLWYGDESSYKDIKAPVICKSMDKVKGFMDVIDGDTVLDSGNYLFSQLVDIKSEWRCFVYRGELLGVHNYINSTDDRYYPNLKTVREMISKYDKLDAYTLDVGVNDDKTFLIEVHDFYSCGLYGFKNYQKLLQMYIASHNQKLTRATIKMP